MPTLWFVNLPEGFTPQAPAIQALHRGVQDAMGCKGIKVFPEEGRLTEWLPTGAVARAAGVRVYVDPLEGRTPAQRRKAAKAIQAFLDAHQAGKDSYVLFRDIPQGSHLYINGDPL